MCPCSHPVFPTQRCNLNVAGDIALPIELAWTLYYTRKLFPSLGVGRLQSLPTTLVAIPRCASKRRRLNAHIVSMSRQRCILDVAETYLRTENWLDPMIDTPTVPQTSAWKTLKLTQVSSRCTRFLRKRHVFPCLYTVSPAQATPCCCPNHSGTPAANICT